MSAGVKTVELFFRDFGGGGSPPLVVLHGLMGSSRNWRVAGAELARAGAGHVLAPDLRNHGKSPHADEMSFEAMVADVLAWLDARGLGRVTLLGHSMGGKVAMALACRHPARVGRLVVVDVAPREYFSEARRNEFAAMNELDLRALSSRAEAESRLGARVGDRAMLKFLAANLERREGGGAGEGGWGWTANVPAITAALAGLEANPLREGERFLGTALFVAGGKSDYVGDGDKAVILRHFPGARIEVIAGAGHNPHVEAREEFARVVAENTGIKNLAATPPAAVF